MRSQSRWSSSSSLYFKIVLSFIVWKKTPCGRIVVTGVNLLTRQRRNCFLGHENESRWLCCSRLCFFIERPGRVVCEFLLWRVGQHSETNARDVTTTTGSTPTWSRHWSEVQADPRHSEIGLDDPDLIVYGSLQGKRDLSFDRMRDAGDGGVRVVGGIHGTVAGVEEVGDRCHNGIGDLE